MALVGEPFTGFGQQSPGPVERVVFAAAVAQGLVLDCAAGLIQAQVGVFDQVERVMPTSA